VLVPVFERLAVLELAALARRDRAHLLVGLGLPDTNVGVVTAREHDLGVGAELDTEDPLHALGVVHLATLGRVDPENADRAVVRARDKLATGRRVRHVHTVE
jgi:hypothetical protein